MTEIKTACLLFTGDLKNVLLRRIGGYPWNALQRYIKDNETPQETIWGLIENMTNDPRRTEWIGETKLPKRFN